MEPFKRTTLIYSIFTMAVVITDPVFAVYLSQQGYDPLWLAILLSSFSIGTFLTAPLVGGISDTWGRRPLILMGILFEAAALLGYVYLHHPFAVFIIRLMEAIGYACVTLIAVAKLEDIVAQEKTKDAASRIGMSLSFAKIGYVLGPLAGGIIATYYGIISPFLLAALTIGLLGIWFFFEKHHVHPKPPLEKMTLNPLPMIWEQVKIKDLQGLNVFAIVHQFSIPVLFVFLPIYITQTLGLGFEYVGIALFVKELPLILQFIGGRLTDQYGSKKVMVWGNMLCGVALLAMATTRSFDWLLVFLFIYGIGTSILGISIISFLSGIAQQMKKEGTFLGAHVALSKVGAFTGFIVAGAIVELSSIPTLFLVSGAIILIGIITTEEWIDHSFELPHPKRLVSVLFRHR